MSETTQAPTAPLRSKEEILKDFTSICSIVGEGALKYEALKHQGTQKYFQLTEKMNKLDKQKAELDKANSEVEAKRAAKKAKKDV